MRVGDGRQKCMRKSEACAAIKPRISSLSIKVERDAELNTSEKSNKLRIEKCPLNLVTEQALVTLLRTVSMQYHVQKPDCNSLKESGWKPQMERTLSKIGNSDCGWESRLGQGFVCFKMVET